MPVENLQSLGSVPPCRVVNLNDFGVLRLRGADTLKFLQGQVSNDVTQLSPQRSQLAGYHNPQGRAIALLRLMQLQQDDVLTLLPRELIATVAARLTRFVLRAKVKITDESDQWRIQGLALPEIGAQPVASALPDTFNAQTRVGDSHIVCAGSAPTRWLIAHPVTASTASPAAALVPNVAEADREFWRGLDIESGQPQVYTATSETFVAQMLNLDALEAISFNKGCYTGQEIIARAHYRGRVKRRMQRLRTRDAIELAPGVSGTFVDGRSFQVVDAVALPGGVQEFLAVTTVGSTDQDAGPAATSEPATPSTADTTHRANAVAAEVLPLPYSIPE